MRHLPPEIAKWRSVPRSGNTREVTTTHVSHESDSRDLWRKRLIAAPSATGLKSFEGKTRARSDNAETAVLAGGCFLDHAATAVCHREPLALP
jgi:hypothetical protein